MESTALSIGLQSPDDRELKILGRIHNYEQFLETYRSAREAGSTISILTDECDPGSDL